MIIKKIVICSSMLTAFFTATVGITGCSGDIFSNNTVPATTAVETTSKEKEQTDISYTIQYYNDEKTENPSDKTTTVKYGEKTPVLTIKELGFSKDGKKFLGWKVYRESDDTWLLQTINDKKQKWMKIIDGNLPEGYEFKLHGDGSPSVKATKKGSIKLYAIWGD